jgi:hypothetical protein
MHAMRRGDTTGSRKRGVTAAALIALIADVAVVVLPIYDGGDKFLWAGRQFRSVAAILITELASALAVLIGIMLLARYRSALAAGVFTATALWAATPVVATLVAGPVSFDRYQTLLTLGLPALEAIALAIAASIAVRRW